MSLATWLAWFWASVICVIIAALRGPDLLLYGSCAAMIGWVAFTAWILVEWGRAVRGLD